MLRPSPDQPAVRGAPRGGRRRRGNAEPGGLRLLGSQQRRHDRLLHAGGCPCPCAHVHRERGCEHLTRASAGFGLSFGLLAFVCFRDRHNGTQAYQCLES